MKHYFKVLIVLATLCLLLAACGSSSSTNGGGSSTTATTAPQAVALKVFAAASLTESFNEIGKNYQAAHPNVTLTFNYAGSQLLEQQIANGAGADVFASADQKNMKKAIDAGLVTNPQVFARNKLIVILPASNPGKINSLKDLANKGIKIDAEAPSVPAGAYSLQILDKLGKSSEYGSTYESAVKANFVSQEDNVKAVVNKVSLGEADAGFVYRTDVTDKVLPKLKIVAIPDQYNVIAEYPIAATKNSTYASDAQAFVQYIMSSGGQAVLMKYHFIVGQ